MVWSIQKKIVLGALQSKCVSRVNPFEGNATGGLQRWIICNGGNFILCPQFDSQGVPGGGGKRSVSGIMGQRMRGQVRGTKARELAPIEILASFSVCFGWL